MPPSAAFSPRAWGWSGCVAVDHAVDDGSPHVRGDGPYASRDRRSRRGFSPRAWGWSALRAGSSQLVAVLPTCVGMVRTDRGYAMPVSRVLPTCVGMVRPIAAGLMRRDRFSPRAWGWSVMRAQCAAGVARSPHVRGDGPHAHRSTCCEPRSPHVRGDGPAVRCGSDRARRSPHVRGDGPRIDRAVACGQLVLPTCVGMVRCRLAASDCTVRFSPRAWGWSGDRWPVATAAGSFSPRAWGWSVRRLDRSRSRRDVLPTCVGMVRDRPGDSTSGCGSPHVRGDGPTIAARASRRPAVLPTCVGMVRHRTFGLACQVGSPHARGDGPPSDGRDHARTETFSPRAWGWSAALDARCTRELRSPHVRGDGPRAHRRSAGRRRFSPRAWGWSGARCRLGLRARFSPRAWGWSVSRPSELTSAVLPTCVGMVRRTSEPIAIAARFSPRAWGWSVHWLVNVRSRRSPHVRGDGPSEPSSDELRHAVLPTCVGMVRQVGSGRVVDRVLPTCVGMVRRIRVSWRNCRLVLPTRVGMVRCSDSHWRSSRTIVLPTCVGMVRLVL